MPRPAKLDPTAIMRINEGRQMKVLAELADEHEHIVPAMGGGTVAFMQGTHWLCGAIGCNIDSPLTLEGARHIHEYVASRGGRPRIDLTDQAGKDAFRIVAQVGLVLEHAERVLARDLTQPIEAPDVPGLTIERLDATDPEALDRHARFTIGGFTPPGQALSEGEVESAKRAQRHPRSRGFAALIEGQFAATCGMEVVSIAPFPGEEPVRVASLWGAVVGEQFRRRGLQQALIAQRLRQGVAEGCTVAVIECEPGIPTERNATSAGFGLAYTRLAFKAPASERSPERIDEYARTGSNAEIS